MTKSRSLGYAAAIGAGLVVGSTGAPAQNAKADSAAIAAMTLPYGREWAQLFAHVLNAYFADQRDPTSQIRGDFSTRVISIRRTGAEERWITRTLTDRELASGDLRTIADSLYTAAKLR